MSPKISVVIVSWNVRDLLVKNLQRLAELGKTVPLEVIVVDNNSSDGSREAARVAMPEARVLVNAWNAGFGAACNRGLHIAQGEVILLLNPDMLVEPGALEKTYATLMEDQTVGVVGIRLENANGEVIQSVRHDPKFVDQLAILLKATKFAPQAMNRYLAVDFDYAKTQDVDQIRGSYFAFRRELGEKLDGFDERFFIWFEEVDFCRRVRQMGLKVRYLADVHAQDIFGQSFRQQKLAWKQRQFTRSQAQYFGKWEAPWQAAILWTLRPFPIMAAFIMDAVQTKAQPPLTPPSKGGEASL